jgi:hypothetical protein
MTTTADAAREIKTLLKELGLDPLAPEGVEEHTVEVVGHAAAVLGLTQHVLDGLPVQTLGREGVLLQKGHLRMVMMIMVMLMMMVMMVMVIEMMMLIIMSGCTSRWSRPSFALAPPSAGNRWPTPGRATP